MLIHAAMVYYIVKPGNTLSSIAQREHTSWQLIYRDNRKTVGPDPDLILPGERLKIRPGDKSTPTIVLSSDSGSATRAPAQAPVSQPVSPSSLAPVTAAPDSSFGVCVRERENGGSYAWGTGDGGGAYQFEPGTWAEFAPPGAIWGEASPAQQDQAFDNAVAAGDSSAWSQYDGC